VGRAALEELADAQSNMPLQTRLSNMPIQLQTGVLGLPWVCQCEPNMRFLGQIAFPKRSIFCLKRRTMRKKTDMRFDL